MTASVGSTTVGSSSCSIRTSRGAWSTAPRIVVGPLCRRSLPQAVSRPGPVHASATEVIDQQIGDGAHPGGVGVVRPDPAGQQVPEHPAGDPRLIRGAGVAAGGPPAGPRAGAGAPGGPGAGASP